jgi:hypothetical protein
LSSWNRVDKLTFVSIGLTLNIAEQLVLYPLDTLKTNFQVRSRGVSPLATARMMIKSQGLRSLYRGFWAANIGTAPGMIAYLTIYNEIKGRGTSWCDAHNVSRGTSSLLVPFVAGATADISSLVLYTPFDVVVTHMQRSERQATYSGNLPTVVKSIYKTEGRRGFYRGFAAAAMTYTPTSAIWWPAYEVFKRTLSPVFLDASELKELDRTLATSANEVNSSSINTPASRRLGIVVAMSGVMAGVLSYGITNPMDLVRTRMVLQQQVSLNVVVFVLFFVECIFLEIKVYGEKRVLGVLRAVLRNEGFSALFKGVVPRILSAAPASAIGSFTYELALRISLKKAD